MTIMDSLKLKTAVTVIINMSTLVIMILKKITNNFRDEGRYFLTIDYHMTCPLYIMLYRSRDNKCGRVHRHVGQYHQHTSYQLAGYRTAAALTNTTVVG